MATASPPQAEAEIREAKEYWGYLISADRTGTNRLQSLLHGLHNLIVSSSIVFSIVVILIIIILISPLSILGYHHHFLKNEPSLQNLYVLTPLIRAARLTLTTRRT